MGRPVAVERGALATTYLVLAAAAALSAVIEAFLVPERTAGVVGLSLLLAVVGNVALGLLGGVGTRTWAGSAIPLVAWAVVLAVLSASGPGGDVILPGALPPDPPVAHVSVALLFAGLIAGAVAVVLTSRYTTRVNAPRQHG
ncbi:MAG: hypothetical protein JO214_20285 [Frankiaceae bacterium]|nr:hypothetical protein [Frankiaceae bacterium]